MSGEWTKLACTQYLRYLEKMAVSPTVARTAQRVGAGLLVGGAAAGSVYAGLSARDRALMRRELGDPRLKENLKNVLLLKPREERIHILNRKYTQPQRADGVKTAVIGHSLGAGFGYMHMKDMPAQYRQRKAGLPPNLAFHYAKNQRQKFAPMHGSFY